MPAILRRHEFDADYYLQENGDVRDALVNGTLTDAYEHYRAFGSTEGRKSREHPPHARTSTRPRVWAATARNAAPPADACPVCRSFGPIPPLLEDNGHILHRCPACRTCFYADRTMPDYEKEVEVGFYQQLYLEQNGSIHHMLGTLFMTDNEGVDSLLDVGCGFGFPVDMAAKTFGWRAVGIDPAHYAREGARLLHADIRKEYLTEATDLGTPFGLVVASEVIEHVPDPDAFLLILRRWLQPGRTLILTTPSADAIEPGAGEAELVSILAIGTHLILFSAPSLELALTRAGFLHVEVETHGNTLVALASDTPIRRPADAAWRHIHAYQDYLGRLLDSAPPGSPLWNGAAGRLLQLRVESAPTEEMHALFARVQAAWKAEYAIDLVRGRLPPTTPEHDLTVASTNDGAKALMWALGTRQPINLATVLFCRALLEARRPGRLPEDVLRWARPAYTHAVDTVRVLAGGTMIDLDLRSTARRARLLMLQMLAELTPELEPELLLAAPAAPAPLRDLVAPTPETLIPRAAPCFTRLVQANRFAEAQALEPWLRDLDQLVQALAADPTTLFYALFTLGVLRLVHENRNEDAALVFERLAHEAGTRRPGPEAEGFHRLGLEHVALARGTPRPEAP